MVEVGKTYYFIVHAYHHFIAQVVAITGKREVTTGRVVRVQSCERDWTGIFKDGCKGDTNLTWWPDGSTFQYLTASPWHHPIPEAPDAAARRKR